MAGEKTGGRRGLYWMVVIVLAAGTFAALAMAVNISNRKAEAKQVAFKIVDLKETTVDPAEWGKNFPRQYDGYIRTVDNQRTLYGGSDGIPSGPEGSTKAFSKLVGDPRLKTIFNGYAFAIDYRERRGHAFMLDDQRDTERVKQRPQPGACLMCHASNLPAIRQTGIDKGAPG